MLRAMLDLLLPRTDAGVAVQAVIALAVFAGLGYAVRKNRDYRIFVAGLAVMTAALFGVRMIH